MSDGTRRFMAVLIMVVGAAFLWLAGPSSGGPEAAKTKWTPRSPRRTNKPMSTTLG